MSTVIRIDLDAVDRRLHNGDLWTTGWGDWQNPDKSTCLHGAIRYCQPVPGDAYLIEQVGERFGFGIRDNDDCDTWASVRAKVVPDITDTMLAETFGPQWSHIVDLVRRAATLTADEAVALREAALREADMREAFGNVVRGIPGGGAAWNVAWDADAAWNVAWDADAAWNAAWDAARSPAGPPARDAAMGLIARDLIGQYGFTQTHYDVLTGPWRTVIGPVHPDDATRRTT